MGSKKGFVKGLAAGAVLGAVAALMSTLRDRDLKAKELESAALKIKDKVAAHAKRLGKMSKSAYHSIVETTVAEYRGMKALSEDELDELKAELKGSWDDVKTMWEAGKKKKGKRK